MLLPIVGTECFTVYASFARKVFSNPKLRHTVRDLADATGIGFSTVSRSLKILERLRLVNLTRFGGSKDSQCQLLDSRVLANRLSAICDPATLAYDAKHDPCVPKSDLRSPKHIRRFSTAPRTNEEACAIGSAACLCRSLPPPQLVLFSGGVSPLCLAAVQLSRRGAELSDPHRTGEGAQCIQDEMSVSL